MASSVSAQSSRSLTRSEAKSALNEVIRAISDPSNCQKMTSARLGSDRWETTTNGPKMIPQLEAVRHMQYVFPMATQIMTEVIANYGFPATGEGLIQFTLAVRQMECMDEDIKKLNTRMKQLFLPTLVTSCGSKSSAVWNLIIIVLKKSNLNVFNVNIYFILFIFIAFINSSKSLLNKYLTKYINITPILCSRE